MAGAAAVTVPGMQFLRQLQAAAPAMKRQHKSLIILWMGGGPSTIDLWDLKPGSPNGGEFKPISTAASGIQISEHLPSVAKQMKNLSIIRSLNSKEGDHARGTRVMNTGHTPSPVIDYPSIGSVASLKLAPKELDLPAFISVGGTAQGIGPGFLGMTYAPFTVQNPGQLPENIKGEVDDARMKRRVDLFNKVETGFTDSLKTDKKLDGPAAAKAHSDIYGKAFSLSVSQRKEIFTFDKEPKSIQDEYGNNNFGKGCLLARKLVEAGAVCVEVDLGGWDMHNGIFPALSTRALPTLDKAMAALVRDLNDRGLYKDTVVLWMGDFGRTPKINQNAGRDHWARCWSVVVGGGNIKGGQVYGATDKDGTGIAENEVSVADLYSTVYWGIGVDPSHEKDASVRDNLGRPFNIAGEGAKPIKELLSIDVNKSA
jgi:hypothetical protein